MGAVRGITRIPAEDPAGGLRITRDRVQIVRLFAKSRNKPTLHIDNYRKVDQKRRPSLFVGVPIAAFR